MDTLGVFNLSTRRVLNDLESGMSYNSGDAGKTRVLFQRVLVVQRANVVLLHASLPVTMLYRF